MSLKLGVLDQSPIGRGEDAVLALRRTLIGPPTGPIKPRNLQFFRRNFGGPAVQGKVGRE